MPHALDPITVGFDIGGTNLKAGVVSAQGEILEHTYVPTPRTEQALEEALCAIVQEFGSRHDIAAVGVAIAGFLDPHCEIVRFAPHLPWRDAPVRDILHQRLGLPVRIEHDANSAAWGELRFGAGRDARDWVYFALGTGIGATLVIDGEIYRGAFGTAPEFGHLPVVAGGRECPCGKRGCLERYASGTALVTTAQELAMSKPERFWATQLAAAVATGEVTGKTVMNAAAAGDELGKAVVADFTHWLNVGLAMVADVLDPELIVVGGGVSKSASLFLPQVAEGMSTHIVGAGFRPQPRLASAELGSMAGIIGVADLART